MQNFRQRQKERLMDLGDVIKSMPCYLKNHTGEGELFLFEDCVKIVIRNKEVLIPFNSMIAVIYKAPCLLLKGRLEFKTSYERYGKINWGFGITTQFNDSDTVLFNKCNARVAREIKEYIEYRKGQKSNTQAYYSKLMKLKKLFDDGIITQEEYKEKKEQIRF